MPKLRHSNHHANELIYYTTAQKWYKKGVWFRVRDKHKHTREEFECTRMDLYGLVQILECFSIFLNIYCRSSGMQTEVRVSLGSESFGLGLRHGDSQF
jgi:hypothetical protein